MIVRPRPGRRLAPLVVVSGLVLVCWQTWAGPPLHPAPPRPAPDCPNIRYGPHERNVLDLWKPPANSRTAATGTVPIVVFFHGGGFRQGDKESVSSWLLAKCLDRGIAVASANYRLSTTAPFPAPMLDGARAVQYLRARAAELGIDPNRIGVAGNSAGGGIALWLAYHDDLVDPRSTDPIARESSRVACVSTEGGQTSYDLRFIRREIGGRAHEHPALRPFFGLDENELDSPRAHRLFEAASPINFLSRDDPPALLFYGEPNVPLPDDARPGQGIHHPRFGLVFKERLDPLGVECIVRNTADFPDDADWREMMFQEMADWFARHLRGPARPASRARAGPDRPAR